jgi:hypothetical protein
VGPLWHDRYLSEARRSARPVNILSNNWGYNIQTALLYCIVCTFIALNFCYIQILRRSILAVINESSPVHITWPPVKGSPCHFILKWGIPVNFLPLKCGEPHRVAKCTIFIKSLVWPGRGLNPRPPGLEADTTLPSQ